MVRDFLILRSQSSCAQTAVIRLGKAVALPAAAARSCEEVLSRVYLSGYWVAYLWSSQADGGVRSLQKAEAVLID